MEGLSSTTTQRKQEMILEKYCISGQHSHRRHFKKHIDPSTHSSHDYTASHRHPRSIRAAFTNTADAFPLCVLKRHGASWKKSPCDGSRGGSNSQSFSSLVHVCHHIDRSNCSKRNQSVHPAGNINKRAQLFWVQLQNSMNHNN